MRAYAGSRRLADRALESSRASRGKPAGRTTAAADTGPAKGPLPASSMPQTPGPPGGCPEKSAARKARAPGLPYVEDHVPHAQDDTSAGPRRMPEDHGTMPNGPYLLQAAPLRFRHRPRRRPRRRREGQGLTGPRRARPPASEARGGSRIGSRSSPSPRGASAPCLPARRLDGSLRRRRPLRGAFPPGFGPPRRRGYPDTVSPGPISRWTSSTRPPWVSRSARRGGCPRTRPRRRRRRRRAPRASRRRASASRSFRCAPGSRPPTSIGGLRRRRRR